MSAAFTPGPWESDDGFFGGYGELNGIRVSQVDEPCYALAVAIDDVKALDAKANARLIAAAPELYEALAEARIAVAADIEEAECGDDGRYASFLPVFVERLAKIDAALAKARGEAQ